MRLHRHHATRRAKQDESDLETPGARGDARVARQRQAIAAADAREPLRRRILDALAQAPSSSPTTLATIVAAEPESVSRLLTRLRDEGAVSVEQDRDDRRKRRYRLTAEGEIELSRHRAFGARPELPPPLAAEDSAGFLEMALESAVDMRRKTNRLDDAAARLRVIADQAHKWGAHGLAVDAMAELATTLRQDRRAEEVTTLLEALKAISLGRDPAHDASLALPATAHREYALGRLGEAQGGGEPRVRASHLITAETLFRQLAYSSVPDTSPRWRQRQAWSIVSLAGNLREQSRFEEALEHARQAMALFEELEDPYGRSRCLFLLGFCLRLMGDFDAAWLGLEAAHRLASANRFERF
jgi:DNA-binding MarR family transcriptional regulator